MNVITKKVTVLASVILAIAQMALADERHLSVSESIAAAVTRPQPEYPQIAKQVGLEGTVSLNAYVTEEGTVERVEQVSGNPVLGHSAEEALMHWKFVRQTEDGKPVKFVASVNFSFRQ